MPAPLRGRMTSLELFAGSTGSPQRAPMPALRADPYVLSRRPVGEHLVEVLAADHFRVFGQHVRRGDFNHHAVFQPELDDVKKWRPTRCAATEIARAPALTFADPFHRCAIHR